MARLRGLIFGKSTEKRKKDKPPEPPDAPAEADGGNEKSEPEPPSVNAPVEEKPESDAPKRRGGKGRTPEAKFVGAQDVVVADESLKDGGPCPDEVCGGKLFERVIRICGSC